MTMTPAGLEPAIPGSVGRCLIHWATGPIDLIFQVDSQHLQGRTDGNARVALPLLHLPLNALVRASPLASKVGCIDANTLKT